MKAVAPGTPLRVAGLETFSLTQINRISVKEKRHRGRNALVGLGVGAAIGLLLRAVGDAKFGTGCTVPKHFGIEALPPLFGGVGALVGSVIPSGGWREIYKQ